MSTWLAIEHLHASYGERGVLHDLTLDVGTGEIVAVLGANGAGKSTLLKAVLGIEVRIRGSIRCGGEPVERLPTVARARAGIGYVPEGRRVFPGMTVRDNLLVACRSHEPGRELDRVHELFPVLRDRATTLAWQLSGGQQQMLAIGRALMAVPKLLLLDEPSLGLAPLVAAQVFDAIAALRTRGVAILLCEQNVSAALAVATRGHLLELGRIVQSGNVATLRSDPAIASAYLGQAPVDPPGL